MARVHERPESRAGGHGRRTVRENAQQPIGAADPTTGEARAPGRAAHQTGDAVEIVAGYVRMRSAATGRLRKRGDS